MRSIRVFAKNMGDCYYEPTIVVYDIALFWCQSLHILATATATHYIVIFQ